MHAPSCIDAFNYHRYSQFYLLDETMLLPVATLGVAGVLASGLYQLSRGNQVKFLMRRGASKTPPTLGKQREG